MAPKLASPNLARTAWIALVLTCVGCGPSEAPNMERVDASARVALDNAQNALEVAYGTVTKEVDGLNLRSAPAALEDGKRRLIELRDRLQAEKNGVDAGRAEQVETQVERLDAALAYRALHERWNAAVREANHGKEVADAKMSAFRADFRAANPSFRKLDDALLAAERRYVQAANRLKALTPP
ncbi:MAG: hypothetical protein KIS66_08955 [Fimbriimonadaceae bacterium]|nr:hypothetical protein [Fimbriimonadaceae bacterium]